MIPRTGRLAASLLLGSLAGAALIAPLADSHVGVTLFQERWIVAVYAEAHNPEVPLTQGTSNAYVVVGATDTSDCPGANPGLLACVHAKVGADGFFVGQ